MTELNAQVTPQPHVSALRLKPDEFYVPKRMTGSTPEQPASITPEGRAKILEIRRQLEASGLK
jgi:hypothetical protein